MIGCTHVPLARLETLVDGRCELGSTTASVTAGIRSSIIPIRYASPGSIELVEVGL